MDTNRIDVLYDHIPLCPSNLLNSCCGGCAKHSGARPTMNILIVHPFEEVIGQTEAGKSTDKAEKVSRKVSEEVKSKTEETGVREGRGEVGTRDRIESRLEFLARMYEQKKAKQDEEKAEVEDVEVTEG